MTLSAILDVADAIEDAYRRRGYVISHAFVPPQRVKDGIFTIRVVEGYVSAVTVQGGDPATQALVRSYFRAVLAERPLKLAAMERALLLANDLQRRDAAGVLRPAPNTPGASELVVSIVEAPVTGGLAMDNRGSRFQGIWTLWRRCRGQRAGRAPATSSRRAMRPRPTRSRRSRARCAIAGRSAATA